MGALFNALFKPDGEAAQIFLGAGCADSRLGCNGVILWRRIGDNRVMTFTGEIGNEQDRTAAG